MFFTIKQTLQALPYVRQKHNAGARAHAYAAFLDTFNS